MTLTLLTLSLCISKFQTLHICSAKLLLQTAPATQSTMEADASPMQVENADKTPNSDLPLNPPKSREEGELSSDDNDVIFLRKPYPVCNFCLDLLLNSLLSLLFSRFCMVGMRIIVVVSVPEYYVWIWGKFWKLESKF